MKTKFKIGITFFLLASTMLISGCGCKTQNPDQYKIRLEVWGLFDDTDAFTEIFQAYTKANPNIAEIKYRKMTQDTYKADVLEALASGKGPDIFLIGNSWLPAFQNKLAPAPVEILNEQRFKSQFVDVAANDFIDKASIFAAPLSVDTLQLYYNKDLFNEAGISSYPVNWDEFLEDVQKLTKIDSEGGILQSGAALGTSRNINRSTDVLGLLMLQTGTQMVDDSRKNATFDKGVKKSDGSLVFPGENALKFYTEFSRRDSPVYSWNSKMHYSIDAFSEGNLAMMFNYSWQLNTIKSKAPKLNFGVAPVPQFADGKPVGYANYWGFAVSQNKIAEDVRSTEASKIFVDNNSRIKEAWKFINYLTTTPSTDQMATRTVAGVETATNLPSFDPALNYITKTQKPAARRDLIEKQKTDPELGVFAKGNLIAKNWYQVDQTSIEALFAQMIDQVNTGEETVSGAMKAAVIKVSQLMK